MFIQAEEFESIKEEKIMKELWEIRQNKELENDRM